MIILIRNFLKNNFASAIVEFSLIMPVLITLWLGSVVANDVMGASKKTKQLSRILADIVTQSVKITPGQFNPIFSAAASVMWPFPSTGVSMRVTSIRVDNFSRPFVDWSISNGGNLASYSRCIPYNSLPASMKIPMNSVILAEVNVPYPTTAPTQIMQQFLPDFIPENNAPLYDSAFLRPRQTDFITLSGFSDVNCSGYYLTTPGG